MKGTEMKKPLVAVAAGAGVFALVAAAAASLTVTGSVPAAGAVESACTDDALLEWEYVLTNSLAPPASNVGWIESVDVTSTMTAVGCTEVRVYLLDKDGDLVSSEAFSAEPIGSYGVDEVTTTTVDFGDDPGVDPVPVASVRVVIS
jgi:hypothetical protein